MQNVSLHFLQPATDSAYLGRLAHFDVMRVIGRGGMGLVLEAFDSRLQRSETELIATERAKQRFASQRGNKFFLSDNNPGLRPAQQFVATETNEIGAAS